MMFVDDHVRDHGCDHESFPWLVDCDRDCFFYRDRGVRDHDDHDHGHDRGHPRQSPPAYSKCVTYSKGML